MHCIATIKDEEDFIIIVIEDDERQGKIDGQCLSCRSSQFLYFRTRAEEAVDMFAPCVMRYTIEGRKFIRASIHVAGQANVNEKACTLDVIKAPQFPVLNILTHA